MGLGRVEGAKNTIFFHKVATLRNHKNSINLLKLDNGDLCHNDRFVLTSLIGIQICGLILAPNPLKTGISFPPFPLSLILTIPS